MRPTQLGTETDNLELDSLLYYISNLVTEESVKIHVQRSFLGARAKSGNFTWTAVCFRAGVGNNFLQET